MRILYSLLFCLLLPLVIARLWWRGIKAPAYRQRWPERLGIYTTPSALDGIWFHAVSVGEAEALLPLVHGLRQRYPNIPILVTTTTPTGSARVVSALGGSVAHVYVPYDLPFAVKRFLAYFRPRLAVIMETEIWPNLLHRCAIEGIPVFIANGRLTERSARRYRRGRWLFAPVMASISGVAAQTQDDARRFAAIGCRTDRVQVTGNIKFDVDIPAALAQQARQLRAQVFPERLVWVAGSTHEGEEAMLLAVYQRLHRHYKDLLLLLVPRHPERFGEVYRLCRDRELQVARRSAHERCDDTTAVYLGDSMGELRLLYAAADMAFVGGSLVPVGGHNVLEPAALGVPVLFGPHMFHFQEIAARMTAQNAALQSATPEQLLKDLESLIGDPQRRDEMGARGKSFIACNQGATLKILDMLQAAIVTASVSGQAVLKKSA